ncbi:GNAT family N-acetyltransferase [Bailinhaonella thermotolerans]|uniref:GNAT family N-acetyltransferase n=1 Tax=Bailinhaonella thermotolerans TaxID=1070861 RepID=UPI001F5B8FFC|nr:GNAT family N-acetyltransferase [Bailinhaonella thermotolerans]
MGAFDETVITTERLLLTPLREEDAAEMTAVLGAEELHEFIGGRPATEEELVWRYRRLAAGSPDPDVLWRNWIVRLRGDSRPVGTVQATIHRRGEGWTAEAAWVIGLPHQGRGYAGEAATALVRWLYGEGAAEVSANVHPGNTASERVAARAGLTLTGEEVDGERVWRGRPIPSVG